MQNRKILFVDLAGPFGGIETYLLNLSQILAGQAEMYALCVNARLKEALRAKNVQVVPESAMKDRGKIANLILAACLLIWMRFRFGISIVWVQGYSEILLLPLARLLGCKAVATRHLTLGSEANRLRSKIARKAYEHLAFTAHRIFCVSDTVANGLRSLVDESRLAVIPNWVASVPKPLVSVPKGTGIRLLFVGRLQPHKGVALIIAAMRQMRNSGSSDRLSLTVVGEGECRHELETLAEGLDVRFAGFQSDPSRFYRTVDVFINPSLGPEGLPLVSLEAMSYGLPCIFSDLDVHREISDNGRNAMLFTSGSSVDLCTVLFQILENPASRSEFGSQARLRIIAKHSPECAKSEYLKCLGALTSAA